MPQAPAVHAGMALGTTQALPQAPQLLASSWRSFSQPSAPLPLQSAKPGWQAALVQAPDWHVWWLLHATPQPPQLPLSVATFCSQPVAALPSQSAKPGLHAIAHEPALQAALAWDPMGQALPHAPQSL